MVEEADLAAARPPVAGQIERDNVMRLGEMRNLVDPVLQLPAEAMQEHQWLALSGGYVMDGYTIMFEYHGLRNLIKERA
jgi:hypothetical protein